MPLKFPEDEPWERSQHILGMKKENMNFTLVHILQEKRLESYMNIYQQEINKFCMVYVRVFLIKISLKKY